MEKVALKTYKDPIMNSLIQHKATWNKQVSMLINDIIHYKKLINGHPNKFYQQKGSIVYDIPGNPTSILDSLMSEFTAIATGSYAIIKEQTDFVAARNKKKSLQTLNKLDKAHDEPQQPQAVDIAKQIKASNEAAAYYMITEASNPLTRFFAKMLNPGFGFDSEAARIRKLRMSLLNFTADINKCLKILQKNIAGSGSQSIFNANQMLDRTQDNYVYLSSGIQSAKEKLPQVVQDAGGAINVNRPKDDIISEPHEDKVQQTDFLRDPTIQHCMIIIKDIITHGQNFKSVPGLPALNKSADLLRKAIDAQDIKAITSMVDKFIETYNHILTRISVDRRVPQQKSLAAIEQIEAMRAKQEEENRDRSNAEDHLQSIAQNILGKWKHQLSPFDRTSSFRLDLYNAAKETRKIANTIMDHLESGFNIESLSRMIVNLGNSIFAMKAKMDILMKGTRGTSQPQFMSLLEKGKISDYGVDLDSKEKVELQKRIKNKRLTELTKKYVGR